MTQNDMLSEIESLSLQWATSNYPYHTIVSLTAPQKSFVRHPAREMEITSSEVLLFLMAAGLQHGGEWHYWVDKNLLNPFAPDQIAAALTTGYDRVTYRALYALQAFDKDLAQKAIEKVKDRIKDSMLKKLDDYVYQGKALDYIREQQRSSDPKKAEKAAEVFREISSFCKTAPDFGADDRKRVFISYNHKDSGIVDSLRRLIEQENIGIIIDTEYLRFGDSIKDFIGRSVKESDYTLAVISNNSLSSPWVIHEALETFMHEHMHGKTKYIPLVIDNSFYEDKFHIRAVERVDQGIYDLVNDISELSKKGVATTVLDMKKNQLIKLRNKLGTVLGRLADNMYADCTTPESTMKNIKRLCRQIQET